MNTKKMAFTIALLSTIVFTSGYAVASLLLSHTINTSLIVKPVVSMGVLDIDGQTELNSIALGQFQRGMEKYYPIGQPEIPYFINNTDEMDFYVSFVWTDLPPYSENYSWMFWIKRGDQAGFTQLMQGVIYDFPIMTHLNTNDTAKQYAVWYFKFIIDPLCPFGTYTPTLTVNAYETASG